MNDTVIITHIFEDGGMSSLLELTRNSTLDYCNKHNIDFIEKIDSSIIGITGHWRKVELIRELLPKYKYLMWLDADAFINRKDIDIRQACKGVSAVKFYYPNKTSLYNVGVMYMENKTETLGFIDKWLMQTHRNEQVVFNEMANRFVTELPSTWNYTIDRHFKNSSPNIKGFHSIRKLDEKLSAMRRELK